MTNHTVCKIASSDHTSGKPICKKERSNVKLEDLPQDVLCTMISKLPAKEVSRASVLSSHWRYISGICFYKLCFTGAAGCCRDSFGRDQYCQYMQKPRAGAKEEALSLIRAKELAQAALAKAADTRLQEQAAEAAAAREAAAAAHTPAAGDADGETREVDGVAPTHQDRGQAPVVDGLVDVCVQLGEVPGRGRGKAAASRAGKKKANLAPRRNQFKKGRTE